MILKLVIDSYIETAEPVGSRVLSKRTDLSSATIRNEMADLEEMGFLEQPHTSAGRIPTSLGYRFYVDSIMSRYTLTMKEIERVDEAMRIRYDELNRLVAQAGSIVSMLTRYTAVAITPSLHRGFIRRFTIVPIDEMSFLLVLAANTGEVKNRLFRLPAPVGADTLKVLDGLLNLVATNRPIGEITWDKIRALESAVEGNREIVSSILRYVSQTIDELGGNEVYLAGARNILNHPEFQDLKKAQGFWETLEDKEMVRRAVAEIQKDQNQPTAIAIGDENPIEAMRDTSMVICRYEIGGDFTGAIGIIGPTRMNYSHLVSSMEYFTDTLNKLLRDSHLDVRTDKGE